MWTLPVILVGAWLHVPMQDTWGLPGVSSCGQGMGQRFQRSGVPGDIWARCRPMPLVSHEHGECVLTEHTAQKGLSPAERDPCFICPSLHLGQAVTEGQPSEGL